MPERFDKVAWRRWAATHRAAAVDPRPFIGPLAALLADVDGWIATYRPLAHEVDVRALEDRPGLGPFALTRTPPTGRDLTLHRADQPLERHRWGFEQPAEAAAAVPVDEVGAVLVPGLLFDRRGQRLGHGLGYYDRFLARLPAGSLRVGVAPSASVVDQLPAEAHDQPMTHLATELGVTRCPLPPP